MSLRKTVSDDDSTRATKKYGVRKGSVYKGAEPRRQDGTRVGRTPVVPPLAAGTSPWTTSVPMRRNPEPMFEYACHEGNYSMPIMLGGARREEAAAGER